MDHQITSTHHRQDVHCSVDVIIMDKVWNFVAQNSCLREETVTQSHSYIFQWQIQLKINQIEIIGFDINDTPHIDQSLRLYDWLYARTSAVFQEQN